MALPSNVELILMKWLGEDVQVKKPQSRVEALLLELMESGTAVTPEEVQHIVDVEIAKVVAEAPEDFDTLMEIADWIEHHEDDAAAMNSAIQANTRAITALQTAIANVYTKSESDARYVQKEAGKGLSANDFTTAEKTKLAGVESWAAVNAESVTWAALKSLHDDEELVAGKQYRITDFVTTTVQSDTQSAGHAFDVIVIADSPSVLNENARAIQHDGDTYFSGQKLDAWKLKYDIDNDTDRYGWADTTNGKGVIYELEDEYGNKCGYDFKNIQMKFYKITATTGKTTGLVNTYSASRQAGVSGGNLVPSAFTIDSADFEWRYTFDLFTDNTHKDYSLNNYASNGKYCYDNVVNVLFGDSRDRNLNKRFINVISFRNTSTNTNCYGNEFGDKNYNFSFGNYCYSNSFGDYCRFNSFGDYCDSNSFGDYCRFNSFGNYCYSNSFGNNCDSNSFGDYCDSNSFGNYCDSNSFGNSCDSNSFGNSCDSNSFGDYCYSNSFGDYCRFNSFGNSCGYNKLESPVSYRQIADGARLLTMAGYILDTNYGYDTWEEEEDEDTGDTIVTGIVDCYVALNEYDDGNEGTFTGNAKITLWNKTTNEKVVLLNENISVDYGDSYESDTVSGNFSNPEGNDAYIIYEIRGTGNCEGIYWTDSDGW